MPYVVTEDCIKCKFMDCVETCPVNCFYEGENMLVIHPDECIDCAACEPTCPVNAIVADDSVAGIRWSELNTTYSSVWPRILEKSAAPEDAKKWEKTADKFSNYFSPRPGYSLGSSAQSEGNTKLTNSVIGGDGDRDFP